MNASSAGTLDLIDEPLNALGGSTFAASMATAPFTNSLLFISLSFMIGCRKERKDHEEFDFLRADFLLCL